MDSLIQLIYASQASPDFQEHEIPDLLKLIRPANAKYAITGILLYIGTSFVQVLEGATSQVDAVYARILRDKRHGNVTQLVREPIQERSFGDWTMDFATVGLVEAGELIGIAANPPSGLDAHRVKRLIAAVRQPSWQKKGSDLRLVGRAG
jgi:hypothetical protein